MVDPTTIRLGLGAMRAVCNALGRPQLETPTVLVAGTNGKGSTASMLETIARKAGLSTGFFHSPTLGDDHEQIMLGGDAIDADRFVELREDVTRAATQTDALTDFETTTAAAFLAFARSELDLAVVEVGLGGARDATNVAEPIVSVLTTVDFDHQRFLGTTLASIAREKAGIFRRRRPAVIGYLRGPALRAARQEAEAIGARVISARSRVRALGLPAELGGSIQLETEKERYRLDLTLRGEHQAHNAVVAVLAAEALASRFPRLNRAAMETGIRTAFAPGRLEEIDRGGQRFLLDTAHNPAAAAALTSHLKSLPERHDLLFGAFADKDHQGMLDVLRPAVGRLLLTPIDHERSWTAADLSDAANSFGGEVVSSPAVGLAEVRGEAPLLVAGSTRLVGDVRRRLLEPATIHAASG